MQKVICPYCGRVAKYVDSSVIYYGHSYGMAYLWQDGPFKKRNAAYRWLSEQMELPIEQTHIGMFTVEQCKAALEIINKGVSV